METDLVRVRRRCYSLTLATIELEVCAKGRRGRGFEWVDSIKSWRNEMKKCKNMLSRETLTASSLRG